MSTWVWMTETDCLPSLANGWVAPSQETPCLLQLRHEPVTRTFLINTIDPAKAHPCAAKRERAARTRTFTIQKNPIGARDSSTSLTVT
jgi:hypothetical protein